MYTYNDSAIQYKVTIHKQGCIKKHQHENHTDVYICYCHNKLFDQNH